MFHCGICFWVARQRIFELTKEDLSSQRHAHARARTAPQARTATRIGEGTRSTIAEVTAHVGVVAVRLRDACARRGPHARRVRVRLALVGVRAHSLEPTRVVRRGDARATVVGPGAARRRVALAEGHAPALSGCVRTRRRTVRKGGVCGVVVNATLGVVEKGRERLVSVLVHVSCVVGATTDAGDARRDALVGALVLHDLAYKVERLHAVASSRPQVTQRGGASLDAQRARRACGKVLSYAGNRV